MSKALKTTFLVHALIAAASGAVLLLIPGRFLLWLGWAPIDPIMSRLLGAALLALAWSSFQGWRAREWADVATLVQAEAVFTVLACVGLLRHLLFGRWPLMVWLLFAVFAAFAVAWIVFLVRHRE
ncbi:MAG: hypothetical protein PVI09_01985 [Anaerolineae bacterium]|jgi:hypothetical protein